jgi:DNA repair protein RecO (recombination protein O)
VVLRGVDFSETSRIVTFLTPVRGKLACMALGARRTKSALGSALDTLNRLELVYYWKDGREVQKLAEAALLDGYGRVKGDLDKSLYASFPLEIVYKVAHENEPSEALYETLVRGLDGLSTWRGDVRTHMCWQVVQLLAVAGFALSLDSCAECGKPLQAVRGFSFAGGATCPACRRDVLLSEEDLGVLRALAEAPEDCPPVEASGRVFSLLRRYAMRQIDTDFRSLRVIEQALD